MKWEKLPKPWSKTQCRRRYVECDDDIGIRGVAKLSGRAPSTIQKWSAELIEGRNWHQQRIHFQSSLGTTTRKKIIEKVSTEISNEFSSIVAENYQVHEMTRNYIARLISQKVAQLAQDLKLPDEYKKKAIAKHTSVEINNLSQALKRSTDAISEILGLRYHVDMNAATQKVRGEGYEIIDPSKRDADHPNISVDHVVVDDDKDNFNDHGDEDEDEDEDEDI